MPTTLAHYKKIAKKYNIDYSNNNWSSKRSWDIDLKACLARELKEETNLDIGNRGKLVISESKYSENIGIHAIVIFL